MGKNYNNYHKNNKPTQAEKEFEATQALAENVEETVEVASEKPQKSKKKVGFVHNCEKLNIRVAPNKDADIAIVINKDTKVKIDMTKSTDDFYEVDVEMPDGRITVENGYCMKQYIKVK